MRDLTRLYPVPETMTLGGRDYLVIQGQLKDLATLQGWMKSQVPHPLDGLPPLESDPDPGTRKRRLRTASEAAEAWPPSPFTPEGWALLETEAGAAVFLGVALRKCQRDITPAEVLATAEAMTDGEWTAIHRVFWGGSPLGEIMHEIRAGLDQDPDDLPDWGGMWESLRKAGRLGTYERVGNLYFSQATLIRTGGADDDHTIDPPTGMNIAEQSKWGAELWMDPDEIARSRGLDTHPAVVAIGGIFGQECLDDDADRPEQQAEDEPLDDLPTLLVGDPAAEQGECQGDPERDD